MITVSCCDNKKTQSAPCKVVSWHIYLIHLDVFSARLFVQDGCYCWSGAGHLFRSIVQIPVIICMYVRTSGEINTVHPLVQYILRSRG
jgi:hypothetical protein